VSICGSLCSIDQCNVGMACCRSKADEDPRVSGAGVAGGWAMDPEERGDRVVELRGPRVDFERLVVAEDVRRTETHLFYRDTSGRIRFLDNLRHSFFRAPEVTLFTGAYGRRSASSVTAVGSLDGAVAVGIGAATSAASVSGADARGHDASVSAPASSLDMRRMDADPLSPLPDAVTSFLHPLLEITLSGRHTQAHVMYFGRRRLVRTLPLINAKKRVEGGLMMVHPYEDAGPHDAQQYVQTESDRRARPNTDDARAVTVHVVPVGPDAHRRASGDRRMVVCGNSTIALDDAENANETPPPD
jgi:hypothetical protein